MTKSVFTDLYCLFTRMLIQERRDKRITQTQLARMLKKPQSYVSKYENEHIKVTYTKASTRITVDSKKLKEDLPGIYSEYSKIVNVSSYVNIDIK